MRDIVVMPLLIEIYTLYHSADSDPDIDVRKL
jgi:hypothetical protein